MKKIPMRMCVVTREKLPKKELIRIVKSENKLVVDATGKLNGKGCYLSPKPEVVELAKKKKSLNQVFELEVDEKIYEEILQMIN